MTILLNRIVIIFLFVGFSELTSAKSLTLNIVTENLPPLSYIDEPSGKVTGICTELIREVMKQTDLTYDIKLLPWARALRKAEGEKNTVIFSIGRIPEREDSFIWLEKIHTINYFLYALESNKKIINLNKQELKRLSVAVSLDDVNYVYLKKEGYKNTVHINDYEQMFKLLQRKRVDVLASNDLGVKLFSKTYPESAIKVSPVKGFSVPQVELYFAINKNSDNEIITQLLKGFEKVKSDGTFQRILAPILNL